MSVITLTTDFGTRDWFAGTMKGVICRFAPEVPVIDLTHEVPPGDVRSGAFDLAAAVPYFPHGTIHIAVVDPGVGSARLAIALRTAHAIFIGPDNGVLSWAVREEPVEEMRQLTNREWFLEPVSRTFHGRDIFAPVAARLAAGARFEEAGDPLDDFVRLPWPALKSGTRRATGEIVHIDRFGNAITNLPAEIIPPESEVVRMRCGGTTVCAHACYSDVAPGEPLGLAGSSGLLELAVNGGDFADHFGVGEGDRVEAAW